MTNEISTTVQPPQTLTELVANSDRNIYHSLKNSVYPGASDESIGMVLAYCKAKKYDPLGKAVHIVPMQVSTGKKDAKGFDIKEKRDVLMPGIASYRIDADRTGVYAGISEPEYGPMITEKLGGHEITYPEWCKITVRKIVAGQIVEFSAKEYWIENYATGYQTLAPNTMWKKRPRGQITKCAEAQALRKAFPDVIGALPTFEEMEGKTLDSDTFIEAGNKTVSKGLQGVRDALGLTEQAQPEKCIVGVVDSATGEVTLEQSAAPTFEEVKKQMEDAKTPDDLILATDIARSLGFQKEQRDELAKIYKNKQTEVKG